MANQSYWQQFTNRRLSRRRAVALAGGSAAAAAFLAACGGDDSPATTPGTTPAPGTTPTQQPQATSPVYQPVDTSGQGKQGGVLRHYAAADITHFDALAANSASTVNNGSVFAYNRLLKFKSGFYPEVADGSSEPEMAESWEVSPDGLTVTMKIRRGAGTKWDERAPTNGREMNMDDVLFSYNKFAQINPSGANVANARNPAAPVASVEATDESTLVVKLVRPDATIIPLFSATDHLYIMPTESDGGFQPEQEVRGNGPWMLEEYSPSVRFVWKRNPNYYMQNRPFPDTMERPIVTEPAQRLAQFRAGNIYTDMVTNSQEEVLQLKRDVPDALLYLPNTYPNSLTPSIWFGYEGNSPFKDPRVRRAVSMLIDREAFNDALYNADVFAREGLGVEAKYNTCITAGWGPYWLDPTSPDFGDAGKYLQYNPEEAQKLMAAAGFPNGFSTNVHFNTEGTYGPIYNRAVDVLTGFVTNAGNQVNMQGTPYAEFLNSIYFGYRGGAGTRGTGDEARGYDGFSVQAERPYATAVNLMLGSWHSDGGAFHGLTPDGNNAFDGDPALDAMIEDIQGEFDQDAQVRKSHDLIRYMTENLYMVPRPVTSPGYELWWPVVSGIGWRERWPNNALWTETAIDWWIDDTKPPLRRS